MADDMSFNPTRDDFEALLNDSMGGRDFAEGSVVKGKVVGVEKDFAIIDVGLKTEGRVQLKEFGVDENGKATVKAGDTVEVFLERLENAMGEAVISREKAKREEAWTRLEGVYARNEPVMGAIVGRVKGGFTVDLGGIAGLLHVTDMSWKRVNHPSQVLAVGDTVKVQIVKINPDTQRISLGMKQLQSDPWDGVEAKYPVGAKFTGRITNITDYGAFVELEAGVEGLVHVSEMSWTKKNVHPGKIVSTSQEVDVVVLDVDPSKRRVSLGLKQALANPWEAFLEAHPVGSAVEGEVKNATEFGLFIGLDNDIDGMVHLSDIDWSVPGEEAMARYKKGDMVKAKVLDVDVEKERISLGIKQLAGDPMSGDTFRKNQTVTVTVTEVTSGGIEVRFGEDDAPMTAFIRKSDLSRDRQEQRPERFAVGDRVDAQITNVDKAARRVSLSIKSLEMAEEKEAIEQFGSSDSGASLGDILGAALRERASKE